jgi:hypothetical protein
MGALLWIVVIALAFDVALIAALLACRLILAPTTASILDLGPLLVAAGVLTALVAFLVNCVARDPMTCSKPRLTC